VDDWEAHSYPLIPYSLLLTPYSLLLTPHSSSSRPPELQRRQRLVLLGHVQDAAATPENRCHRGSGRPPPCCSAR
jgi:hypothetical protein